METERYKILLVEDDEDDYVLIRMFLAKAWEDGFDLVWASTFEEGVRQFEQNQFSVILIDYRLGVRTGLEYIQEIKSRNNLVPIILLTGHGSIDIDLQVMQAGAEGYLSKAELSAQQLERTIRYAVERKRIEQKLLQQAARYELISNLAMDFSQGGLDYISLVKTIARRVSETYGDGIVIRILEEDGKTLEPVAVYHPNTGARKQMIALLGRANQRVGEGLVGEVAQTREPKLLCDTPAEELARLTHHEFSPWFEKYPVDSVFATPLCASEKLIGTLVVLRNSPAGPITREDQGFYQNLANRAAVSIANAQVHQEVETQALTDALTGIYNRRGFNRLGKQEMERFRRYHHPLSVIVMDIDHFKSVNDRYGHAFGDQVLKALTGSCTENIRQIDIPCRHGGDEFVILLPETDLKTARSVADRIRACFAERTFLMNDSPIHLTASFGVAAATEGTASLDALLEDADTAMYKSKLNGRNRVEAE